MEEDSLLVKMKEFMNVIDRVRKYKTLLSALPDFSIIIALSIIAFLSGTILSKLGIVFVSYTNTDWIPRVNFLQVVVLLVGIIVGVFWVNRKVRRTITNAGQWNSVLNEGAPGALKLLQELDWENVFRDIRDAKIGFWLYGILKIAAYWLLTTAVFLFLGSLLGNVLHFIASPTLVGLFSLALVIVLNKNDFRKRYEQVGRLDALLWELRWFDNEFRRADFKA
jgi:hypothetical protein